MIGTVLQYNANSGRGVISAQSGERYEFNAAQVAGNARQLREGKQVDFVEADGKATEIFPVGTSSSEKNRIAAALLAFFLGAFGVHKFYLGKNGAGAVMLVVFLFGFILLGIPSMVIGIIAFIEFIIYLVKSDDDFHDQYVVGDKSWF